MRKSSQANSNELEGERSKKKMRTSGLGMKVVKGVKVLENTDVFLYVSVG